MNFFQLPSLFLVHQNHILDIKNCRIIREMGQKLTSNNTDTVPNLVITTCTIRQVWGLSQKALVLVEVKFEYLNSSFFISLVDVGFQQKYGDVVRLRVNDYTSFQFL